MKKTLYILSLIVCSIGFSQDVMMQDGTFMRCAPDRFFDSGGEFGNYGNNENFTTTICPQNAGEFIILNFTAFSTQATIDILTIYDGDDTTAPVLGTFSGTSSPGNISASDTNTSGCLTVNYMSNGSGNTTGWEAEILCAVACQTITASIDSTIPVGTALNVVEIDPGETVNFFSSATFSDDDTESTFSWNFGDGNTADGANVFNTFNTSGTYSVTLTVEDNNPVGCQDVVTFSVVVLDAIITVNSTAFPESSFSPSELIDNVLVSGGCTAVDNFSSQVNGNPEDLTTKSYGYFTRGGAVDFPFEEGIILTTGDAAPAGNTINGVRLDNRNGQAGDNDLEAALGITNTNDATFVKFNFIPTTNEISFRYLMASEEYDGSTECAFADSFAFLLREEGTTTYTNLAVLPDNTPVSVTNINNAAGCTSNPGFFEGYNLGETNYGGRTVVLTASATVIPNTTYEIKLVVADQGDNAWDSAIFLEAGSFNLGGELGDDITIDAGTAECGGDSITLDTEAPTAGHTWYFNGVEIMGETSSTLDVSEAGTYSVDVEFAVGCTTSDSIVIEFRTSPVVGGPAQDLVICDIDGTTQFDLSENDDDILGGQNSEDFSISYHLTEQNAIDNVDALPTNYSSISNPQIIWARIADTAQICFATTSFQLEFSSIDIITNITPLQVCDDNPQDGLAPFTLTDKDTEIIGTNDPEDVNVSYHLTSEDAENDVSALPLPYTNTTANFQTIFTRLELIGNESCYSVTTLDLEVLFMPTANPTTPLEACDDDMDGFVEFNLSDKDEEVAGTQINVNLSYHLSNVDAMTNMNPLPILYTNTTTDSQLIYARIENTDGTCYDTTSLQLVVNPLPTLVTVTSFELCDINNPGDEQEQFDLTTKDVEILNGQVNVTVSYYLNETDAVSNMNEILGLYTNTSNNQLITAKLTNTMTGCSSTVNFELQVNPLPIVINPTPLEVCDDGTPDGITQIDLSTKDNEITGNNVNYSINYYETLADANSDIDALPTLYTNATNPETLYVRVEDMVTGCYDTTSLELTVEQAPVANSPAPYIYCDLDNNGFGEFILTDINDEITGGAAGLTVTYHLEQIDADTNVDAIDNSIPYINTTINTQIIYARVESATIATDCATVVQVELSVEPRPQLVDPTPLESCDDILADGFLMFDLTTKASEILDGQDPMQFEVSYYEIEADADLANNPIGNPTAYTNTVPDNQIIWIRVEDTDTLGGCYRLTTLELIVNPLPVITSPTPLELCDDLGESPGNDLTVFDLTVKDSEITGGNTNWSVDYYETNADAQAQTDAIPDPTQYTNSSVDGLPANPQTLYIVVTDIGTGCMDFTTMTIEVLPNPTPTSSDLIPDLVLCDDVNTGDGVEVFNLLGLGGINAQEDLILNGELGVTATYYENAENANLGIDPILDPENYESTQISQQEIYVRITNDATGCYELVDFTIRVNPLPDVVAVTDFIQCELNTDGFASFDLTTKDAEVLNGQDASQFLVTYHENLADAEAEMNALVSPYTNLSNPQQIFVTIINTLTGCSISTQSFNIQLDEGAEANPDMVPIIFEACDDNMETDGDPSNDSVQFDLSTRNLEVLDVNQDAASYIVSYYATEEDANLNVNLLPNLYENITNPQVIYARVDNNTLAVIPIALDLTALLTGLDLDANGTIDTYDTNADGVFDLVDLNEDGLSDGLDTNGDGLIEFIDSDGDGQGEPVDLNNDGIFDNQQDSSICFAVASLTLQVNPIPEFNLDESYVFCINTNGTEVLDEPILDTELSETDFNFEWSYNGTILTTEIASSLTALQGGTYSVTVTNNETNCVNTDTTEVIESELPSLQVDVVTQAFGNTNVIEAVADGSGSYEYSLDGGPWQDSGTFTDVSQGQHEVTARDKIGCGQVTELLFVVDYPTYFTPNGDGNHDTWNIANIGSNAKIYIFDRYGKLLKQLSPTGSGWDGTFNGDNMPPSDYWFRVEYNEPLTGDRKEFKAHFTLKR